MLMCSPRSLYPWDLILIREGDKLFIDKRDQGPLGALARSCCLPSELNSSADNLTVNENAQEPPVESDKDGSINTPSALAQQATFVNEMFQNQVIREDPEARLDFENPNPFYSADETEPLQSCGYRYRKFDLSITENEEVDLIVRTEVDALLKGGPTASAAAAAAAGAEESFITIKTLFEFDSRAPGAGGAVDWRTKLDTQRGAVIATEMRNNSCKLARWAVQGVLAGAENMKIGCAPTVLVWVMHVEVNAVHSYVSRANPRDDNRHVILGTQWFKPRDFANQMNVNLANGWGIVRTIIDLCMAQQEGKYVLLKDPNKVRRPRSLW
jgi:translation initiation factor 3 subunit D